MNLAIYPYKIGSGSAKALQANLIERIGRRVKRVRSSALLRNRPRIVLNWGNAHAPQFPFTRMINNPAAVNVAGNKLLSFQALQAAGVSIPEFTTDALEARGWLEGEEARRNSHAIVVRHSLRGHSGEGIELHDDVELEVSQAPLYVKYKKKKHEFRVHVFNGSVIDIQQKKKQTGVEQTEEQKRIRSHANGWVFCREELDLDDAKKQRISELAVSAITALHLDFGAVDIIYNQHEDTFYVLEVNTAPGLEGQTLESYTNAISNFIGV